MLSPCLVLRTSSGSFPGGGIIAARFTACNEFELFHLILGYYVVERLHDPKAFPVESERRASFRASFPRFDIDALELVEGYI